MGPGLLGWLSPGGSCVRVDLVEMPCAGTPSLGTLGKVLPACLGRELMPFRCGAEHLSLESYRRFPSGVHP